MSRYTLKCKNFLVDLFPQNFNFIPGDAPRGIGHVLHGNHIEGDADSERPPFFLSDNDGMTHDEELEIVYNEGEEPEGK